MSLRTPSDSDFLEVRKSGNGENVRLTKCPICFETLDDVHSVSRHIEEHSWDELMAARDRSQTRAEGGGQMSLRLSTNPAAP